MGENSVKGTEFKLNINMTPMGRHHLANINWEVKVFTDTSNKSIIIKKDQAVKVDDDNYMILVNTDICGAGKYFVTLIAEIPDSDFGTRTEKKTASTGVKIDIK